jgi:hypothetical protein
MSEPQYIVLILLLAIAGVIGLAALADFAFRLRRKRAESTPSHLLPRGPIARVLFWVGLGLLAAAVLSLVGFFVLRSVTPVWIGIGSFIAYFVVGVVYRIALRTGW